MLEGLRAFDQPRELAARYAEPPIIIPQAETRRFAFAALVGVLVLLALTPLSDDPAPGKSVAMAIFAWLGALTVFFGLRSAFARRSGDAPARWMPRDRNHANRAGSLALIGVGILAYGAPVWLFAQLTHGLSLPATLRFDPAFHAVRLPVLFALWIGQALMLVVLALRGRWNRLLRRVDTLEIGVVLVLAWFVAAGRVMQAAVPNQVASNLISVIAVLMCIEIGVKLYRGLDPFSSAQGWHADASLREGHS